MKTLIQSALKNISLFPHRKRSGNFCIFLYIVQDSDIPLEKELNAHSTQLKRNSAELSVLKCLYRSEN